MEVKCGSEIMKDELFSKDRSILEAQNLKLSLVGRDQPVFERKSLLLRKGERLTLTGPSGCGKTLFLRSLCLLESAMQGEIYWQGRVLSPSEIPSYRSKVIYVGQRSILQGTVESSFEEVFCFKSNAHKRWHRDQIQGALSFFFESPNDYLSRDVARLSGGEKQIVLLLRALAVQPEVLCLDEPTSALDMNRQQKVETWLLEHYAGAWIWVTHQADRGDRMGHLISFNDLV